MTDARTGCARAALYVPDLMGRQIDADDLVSAVEIAQRLGMKRPQVVYDWRRRHPAFPAPVAVVGAVSVWAWPDVERWARETGRL